MKYLVALLVLCLALLEFFYHWHSGHHAPHPVAQPDAQDKPLSPRELLRQHQHHHH